MAHGSVVSGQQFSESRMPLSFPSGVQMASMASVIVYNLTQSHSKAGIERRGVGQAPCSPESLIYTMEEKRCPEAVWKRHWKSYYYICHS